MATCVCPCACGRESSPSMVLCSACAGSGMCANRRDARAALEVATKALERIRDENVFRSTGYCTACGNTTPQHDHESVLPCGIASRALATIRGMVAPAPAEVPRVPRGHCGRCDRCGWPFDLERGGGCRLGDCSSRPTPILRTSCAGCGALYGDAHGAAPPVGDLPAAACTCYQGCEQNDKPHAHADDPCLVHVAPSVGDLPQGAREAMTHSLKCWPVYFEDVLSGRKPFEVRKDDRDFREGDEVVLYEWDPATGELSGRNAVRVIGYVARGACIPVGYCVFALLPTPAAAQGALATPGERETGIGEGLHWSAVGEARELLGNALYPGLRGDSPPGTANTLWAFAVEAARRLGHPHRPPSWCANEAHSHAPHMNNGECNAATLVAQRRPAREVAEELVEELSKTAANAVVNQSHYWDKEAAADRLMVSKSDLATDIRREVAKALRALALEADRRGTP